MKEKSSGGIKLNILLLLIISTLIFIATQKPGLNKQVVYEKISHLNINDIKKINIVTSDEEKLTFLQENQAWHINTTNSNNIKSKKIVKPKKIENLLKLLNANSLGSFTASKNQLEQYHLMHPRITVSFDNFTIAFGNNEPLKHRRYTLIDNKIHLINDVHYHLLLQLVNTFTKKP